MSQKVTFEFCLVLLLVVDFLYYNKASSQCAPYEFTCSNGNCISSTLVCDKYDGCDDNSDEQDCAGRCAPYEFQCSDGKCIDGGRVCNKIQNCEDNSDEQQCGRYNCHASLFQCIDGKCTQRTWFCDGSSDCGDSSDEKYCNISSSTHCPPGWHRCASENKCIPQRFVCDWWDDCPGDTDEKNCGSPTAEIWSNYTDARVDLYSRFLERMTPVSKAWGPQLHRIAVSLHFASIFGVDKMTGEKIRYQLTTQLLRRFLLDKRMSSQELALYIHAMLVACMDPRDFYGDDLVRELRRRVDASGNFTNPFLILALCNAGDTMTVKDVMKAESAYHSRHRPFWIDYEALSTMALACISSSSAGGVTVEDATLEGMLQGLKRHQLENGTIGGNLRATALVIQALLIHDSFLKDFDLGLAMKFIIDGLNGNKSLLDAYYALPVLTRKSLLNVTSGHCEEKSAESEMKEEPKVLDVSGNAITVQYSVWMGDKKNAERTWRLRMRENSTIYDAMEIVARIDTRQTVEYNVVDGKPYVKAFNGTEDDTDMGIFWFIYSKTLESDQNPKIVEESPVDIKLQPNQEIILWYKREHWSGENRMRKSAAPS